MEKERTIIYTTTKIWIYLLSRLEQCKYFKCPYKNRHARPRPVMKYTAESGLAWPRLHPDRTLGNQVWPPVGSRFLSQIWNSCTGPGQGQRKISAQVWSKSYYNFNLLNIFFKPAIERPGLESQRSRKRLF